MWVRRKIEETFAASRSFFLQREETSDAAPPPRGTRFAHRLHSSRASALTLLSVALCAVQACSEPTPPELRSTATTATAASNEVGPHRQAPWRRMSLSEIEPHRQRSHGRVLLGFKDSDAAFGVDPFGRILVSNASIDGARALLDRLGVQVVLELPPLPSVVAIVNAEQFAALRRHPLIDYIEPDATVREPQRPFTAERSSSERVSSAAHPASGDSIPWQIARVNAPAAWTLSEGDGVRILYIDSGADPSNPDLNLEGSTGQCDTQDTSPLDWIGHGTKVAGVIGARRNGLLLAGVAPLAKLWSSRVRHPNPNIHTSEIACSVALGSRERCPSYQLEPESRSERRAGRPVELLVLAGRHRDRLCGG